MSEAKKGEQGGEKPWYVKYVKINLLDLNSGFRGVVCAVAYFVVWGRHAASQLPVMAAFSEAY